MTRRYVITDLPAAYRALFGVESYAREHVDKQLLHLIKMRASMINGCAFCLDVHSREAPCYDAGERAALALTDEVTRLGEDGVRDATWNTAVEHRGADGAVNLVVAIGMINLWNRIAVTARAQPPA